MGETGTTPGLTRNRQHYGLAVLAGGACAAVLSVLPVISFLNLFFLFWVMFGGAMATAIVQNKTKTVEPGEGAVIGALSGLVCGLVLLLLFSCFAGLGGVVVLPDASNRETEEFLTAVALALTSSCCASFFVHPLFGAAGGAIGALIFAPDPSAVAGAPGAALTPEQQAAAAARRTKTIRALAFVFATLVLVATSCCCCGGYLYTLEDRSISDTAGEDAVVTVPFAPGQAGRFTLPGAGSGTARYGIWLVTDAPLPPGIDVDGTLSCDEYGEPSPRAVYVYDTPHPDQPGWLLLETEYVFGGSSTCIYQMTTNPPVAGARIVVTQLTRPSDWLDL